MDKLFKWIKENPASSVLRSLVTLAFAGLFTLISIATNGIFLLMVFGAIAAAGLIVGFLMLVETADREKYNRQATRETKD